MKCVRNTFSFQWWQLIANTQQRIYKYKYNHLYTSNADSVRTKIKAIEYIYVVGLRYGWNRRRRLRVANWMTLAFHSCQTDSVFMHSSSVRWIREHWWKLGGNRFLPLRSENKFFSLKMFANALDIVSYFAYRTAYMYFHSLRRIFILLEKKIIFNIYTNKWTISCEFLAEIILSPSALDVIPSIFGRIMIFQNFRKIH